MIKVIRSFRRHYTYWSEEKPLEFNNDSYMGNKLIVVNSDKTFQTHLGFGGAFTEAAAVTFAEAPIKIQDEILKAYFSEQGLKYNLGRTTIHSTDFSEKTRTYIQDDDYTLNSFSVAEDEKFIIPLIRKAKENAPDLWLLASPWSPPAFMKTNNEMYYGGKLKKEYYSLWAKYILKYLKAMEERGIKISALSVQNEPAAAQVWESCLYSAEEEKEFSKILYEILHKAGIDVKILIWDHNRDLIGERVHTVLKDIPDYIWGVAYHWYVSEDSENLSLIHELYPNHHLLFTEGCVEYSINGSSDHWKNGEFYGRNIIKDSLNYSEGFIDWNLLLNEEGGPNHVENYCESPLMYNRQTKTLTYNPSYYYLGHFSRYIKPNAKRILIKQTVDPDIFVTAYKNIDGSIIIIIQNEGWIKQYTMIVDGKSINLSIPDRSITTYIIE